MGFRSGFSLVSPKAPISNPNQSEVPAQPVPVELLIQNPEIKKTANFQKPLLIRVALSR